MFQKYLPITVFIYSSKHLETIALKYHRFDVHEALLSWEEEARARLLIHREKEIGLGWTPDSYPNPKSNPEACGISALFNGSNDGKNNITVQDRSKNLFLCDPDRIIHDLGRITDALMNFTAFYGVTNYSTDRESDSHTVALMEGDYHGRERWLSSQREIPPQESLNIKTKFSKKGDHHNENYGTYLSVGNDSNYKSRKSYSISSQSFGYERQKTLHSDGLSNKKYLTHDIKLKNVSFGRSFLPQYSKFQKPLPAITLGIAVAEKIDAISILREYSFYSFEDEDGTINDAAEYFATYLRNRWWANMENNPTSNINSGVNLNDERRQYSTSFSGVLIFLSVQDRVCFISAGNDLSSVLPWWRLDNIVSGMRADLRNEKYEDAILCAINDISLMIDSGPPSGAERVSDFFSRFGFVLSLSLLTFLVALCSEGRDKKKRLEDVERRSRLSSIDREKAKLLQCAFKTSACPICLEPFHSGSDEMSTLILKTDGYGIPQNGSDGLPLKMLRCGHIFDLSCWKSWVHSGYGNPNLCPVCRQDISNNDFTDSNCSIQNNSSILNEENSIDLNDAEIENGRIITTHSIVRQHGTSLRTRNNYGSTVIYEANGERMAEN